MPKPQHIVHITERSLWETARESGTYEMSTRGRTLQQEGFVHFSTRDQLPRIAAFLYGDSRLDVPLRYEAMPPNGEEFPHVYGAVPVEAVVGVEPWG
ncbi:DUF952 domain-containing protein [Streptomyces sp. NPDC055692]|uniref:DUF952 domain-containing protein n=1 Tax=Streptomyces sp. NPDC055692 TaxID=3155683 RepID=UPI0034277FB4